MRRSPIFPLLLIGIVIAVAFWAAQGHYPSTPDVQASGGHNAQASLAGTAPDAQSEAQPKPTLVPPPTYEPTPKPQDIPADVADQITEIEAQTSYLRGLKPLDEVPNTFLTRSEFHDHYKQEMQASYAPEEVRQYLQELWLMRLVDSPSIDFYEASADLGSDDILGYYDPTQKHMYVITDKISTLSPEAQVTLSHEYTHSLQDQHYHLDHVWPIGVTDRDRVLAIRALVEGDATLSGYAWGYSYMSGQDFSSLFEAREISADVQVKTPVYLGMLTIFPYVAGLNFVSKLMDVGSFSTVNLSLQDPPRSTEQIMHPEKFLQTPIDQPKTVSMPDLLPALGTPWELGESNTLGELDLNYILNLNKAKDPDVGADGWGGGKFTYYHLAQEGLVYAKVTWDTDKDAQEFEDSMHETLAPYEKSGNFWTKDGRFFWMRHDGKIITFVASTNEPALERVVAAEK
ncbi:MAG TPA: hypothetical protein VLQ48_11525 [Chloroflexia bacterium]|nr:hypothetical protein [Chloroflexia bacterium]